MRDFLELVVSASATGCIYGLVALAYLLMIRPTGVVNFAVGEWSMMGAFGGVVAFADLDLPYPLGMAAILIAMFAVGWATERVVVRPLLEAGAPELAPLLALMGMLVVFRECVSAVFGPDPLAVPYPLGFGRLAIGPFAGSYQSFFMIGVTLLVFAATWLFFERTVWGRAFEAVAINRRAAALMGINLRRVTALAFAAGGVVAALAGLLVSPNISAHFLMGLPIAIQGFTALVIGGIGRVEGALLGGLLVAFAEQLTLRYVPIPPGLALGVPLVLLIVFLLVRPTGLLRAREARAL